MDDPKKYFHIGSLAKGIKVLETLAAQGALSVSQVAKVCGYNRAGAHRFLATLRELGYVQQNSSGQYELTFKLLELALQLSTRFEIRKSARGFMQQLSARHKETINLGFLENGDVIHLEKIDSPELLRMDPGIGSRAPAHCTALGKAILAFLPEERLQLFFQSAAMTRMTPNTVTDANRLYEQLEAIRQRGCATDEEELCIGLRCIAVPIFDDQEHPRYSISISGPAFRMTDARIEDMEPDLLRVGRELSKRLRDTGH